jgi:hypothetical protein
MQEIASPPEMPSSAQIDASMLIYYDPHDPEAPPSLDMGRARAPYFKYKYVGPIEGEEKQFPDNDYMVYYHDLGDMKRKGNGKDGKGVRKTPAVNNDWVSSAGRKKIFTCGHCEKKFTQRRNVHKHFLEACAGKGGNPQNLQWDIHPSCKR